MNDEYISSLIDGVFGTRQFTDLDMLKIYATCLAINEYSAPEHDIQKEYSDALNNCSEVEKLVFVSVGRGCNWNKLRILCDMFSSANLEKFLVEFVPELICRPEIIMDVLYRYQCSTLNFAYMVEKFLTLRETMLEMISKKKEISKQIKKLLKELGKVMPMLNVEALYEIFCSVCFYELNYNDVQQVESATKAVDFCVKHGVKKETIPELYYIRNNNAKLNLFCRKNRLEQDVINKCIGKIVNCPILDLMCAVSYNKESTDFLLENNYVYPEFSSSFSGVKNPSVVIVEPSDFFLRKLLYDYLHRNINYTIVFFSEFKYKIYKKYMHDITTSKTLSIDFIPFDVFLDGEKRKVDGVLVFASRLNNAYQEKFLEAMSTICSEDTIIYSFQSSHEFENSPHALSKFMRSERALIKQIDILPTGIEFSNDYKKKVYIRFSFLSEEAKNLTESKIVLRRFWLLRDNRQFLHRDNKTVTVSKQQVFSPDMSIRKLFIDETVVNISGKSRNPSKEYRFSKEISAYYTVSHDSNSKDKVRLRVYLKDFESNGGKIITGSEQRHRISETSIEEYIENTYFFSGNSPINIQKILQHIFWNKLKDSGVLLKTFYYLYCDWRRLQTKDKYTFIFQKAIVSSRAGNIDITYATANDYLQAFFESVFECDLDIDKYIDILRVILDRAVDFGFVHENPLADFSIKSVNYEGLNFSHRQAMRETFSKRTMTFFDTHRFLDLVCDEIDKGNYKYIGALIKLFTNLSYGHICALFWGDLIFFEKHSFYALFPLFCVDENGQIVRDRHIQVLRGIPCVPMLAKRLSMIKTNLEKLYGEEVVKRMPIVSDYAKSAEIYDIYSPESLKEMCKNILVSIDVYNSSIPVEDIIDIAKAYKGDFLSNTFRYWIRRYAHLTENEVRVILGNKVTETADKHYFDYCNPHVLYQMYLKLKNIQDEIDNSKG